MCFWAYRGYFRLSVGGNENRSVFTQQWPSKGNTHSCSVAEENRGKSLCHNWRNQIAALAALSDTLCFITPTCSVFFLHADLDIIWPALILPLFSSDFNKDRFGWPSWVRCGGASLAVRFRSASADWWTLITAGAASAAHQRFGQLVWNILTEYRGCTELIFGVWTLTFFEQSRHWTVLVIIERAEHHLQCETYYRIRRRQQVACWGHAPSTDTSF